MELDEKSIARIRTVIQEELQPALERTWNERAPAMQAAISAHVLTETRAEVRRDHAENRTRLQAAEKTAAEAAASAAAADTKAGAILDRVNEHYELSRRTETAVTTLTREWAADGGLRQGKKAERARWTGWIKAAAGMLTGGGLYKIFEFIHHH